MAATILSSLTVLLPMMCVVIVVACLTHPQQGDILVLYTGGITDAKECRSRDVQP